jgi:DHA2 family multidrug resistance protein
MVTTMIARRAQYHQTVLIDNLTPGSSTFLNGVGGLTNSLTHGGFSLHDAQARAHAVLYGSAQQQGVTLAYIDTFWVLGVISAIMFGLSFLLKRNEPGQGAAHAE